MSLDKPAAVERLLELAIAIQQIPAPTFDEARRAAFVRQQMQAEGLCDVESDAVGNVYARLPGRGEAPPLVLSAHLDTVFSETGELPVRRAEDQIHGPGIGDNSLGVAGLFWPAWIWGSGVLPGDLWLAANVCEEGLGNLRGMQAVVERFGEGVCAYVVLEGMALGQVYHRGLGVRRYEIALKTAGGHSWVDFGRPSAVHEAAALVSRLTNIALPEKPRTTLNVGTFHGGTTVNTIAAEARLVVDLRSEEANALAWLSAQVKSLAQAQQHPGVQVEIQIVGNRPSGEIGSNHPLVRLAVSALEAAGVRPNLGIGSTDANAPLSRGYPAVCVGLTNGGGAHTQAEHIFTTPLSKGLAQLQAVLEGAYRIKP